MRGANMSNYTYLKNYRQRLKYRILKAMGNKCALCGYDKCSSALELHHLNPNEKDFTIGTNTNISWEKAKTEIQKCILVCSNCHREIHAGLITETLSSSYQSDIADEITQEVNAIKYGINGDGKNHCTKCGAIISQGASLCVDCYRKTIRRVDRPDGITLLKEIASSSFCAVGRKYGVTDNAVRKWLQQEGLPTHKQEVIDYVNNLNNNTVE